MSAASSSILLTSITEAIDLFAPSYSGWAIYATGTSSPALVPDSFVSLEYRGESITADYPLEQGAFESYNKVQRPFDVRLLLSCNGQGEMSRPDFLAQLEFMKNSPSLYDIATPDAIYVSLSLNHYDLRRTSTNGVTLLQVDTWWEEIRQGAVASYSTSDPSLYNITSNSPSASPMVNRGTVQVSSPQDGVSTPDLSQGEF